MIFSLKVVQMRWILARQPSMMSRNKYERKISVTLLP